MKKRPIQETYDAILAALAKAPLSCEDIAEATGIPLCTIRPRVSELHTAGEVEPAGRVPSKANTCIRKTSNLWRRL